MKLNLKKCMTIIVVIDSHVMNMSIGYVIPIRVYPLFLKVTWLFQSLTFIYGEDCKEV